MDCVICKGRLTDRRKIKPVTYDGRKGYAHTQCKTRLLLEQRTRRVKG